MSANPANRQTLRTAWLVVALLAPVALLNYLDRQMLASMKFSVMGNIKDIGSDTNWGVMLAQFKWVYAICSPIGSNRAAGAATAAGLVGFVGLVAPRVFQGDELLREVGA